MTNSFDKCLDEMERVFNVIENLVPPPVKVKCKNSFVYRCKEKTIEQAIIQKLTRIVSGLEAALVLNKNGFTQEFGAIIRILDELGEDIIFLCDGIYKNNITNMHEEYLS